MKSKVKIPGKVHGGTFTPSNERNWNNALLIHEGKDVVVTIEKPTKNRSNPQNSYLWAVPYKIIADETGDDAKSVHHAMAEMFLSSPGNVVKKVKSTTKLSTVEFNEYVDNVIKWAAMFLGVYIPLPNEEQMWGDTRRKI